MSEQNQVEKQLDKSSTQEIIQTALTTENEDIYWDLVHILRIRGGDEEFTAASHLCESKNPQERTLGVNIIAQLGAIQGNFRTCERGDIL